MATIQEIPIGTVISFEVYPAAQYGNNYKAVTLQAVFDSNIARMLGFDIISSNQNVYQTLPSGTPVDPTQYSYFQVRFASGETQILGVPWIRSGTLSVHNGKRLTMVFDDFDETRKDRILAAVKAQGENPTSVTFV